MKKILEGIELVFLIILTVATFISVVTFGSGIALESDLAMKVGMCSFMIVMGGMLATGTYCVIGITYRDIVMPIFLKYVQRPFLRTIN